MILREETTVSSFDMAHRFREQRTRPCGIVSLRLVDGKRGLESHLHWRSISLASATSAAMAACKASSPENFRSGRMNASKETSSSAP